MDNKHILPWNLKWEKEGFSIASTGAKNCFSASLQGSFPGSSQGCSLWQQSSPSGSPSHLPSLRASLSLRRSSALRSRSFCSRCSFCCSLILRSRSLFLSNCSRRSLEKAHQVIMLPAHRKFLLNLCSVSAHCKPTQGYLGVHIIK